MKSLIQRFLAGSACFLIGLLACAAPTASATTADAPPPAAEPLQVRSPDGTIVVTLHANGPLTYSVTVDGHPVIEDARLGLKLREGTTFGTDVELASSSARSEDSTWENPLGKRRIVRNKYRELTTLLKERSANDRTRRSRG